MMVLLAASSLNSVPAEPRRNPVERVRELAGYATNMAPLYRRDSSVTRAKRIVKAALNRTPAFKALAYTADDFARGCKLRLGHIQSESGSTHRDLGIDESVSYVEEVFNDYLVYGRLSQVRGNAAEVGPGDNAGVALLLRSAGCDAVDLVDRFRSRRNVEQQRRIHHALAARHGMPSIEMHADDLPGITWKIGLSAEDYFQRRAREANGGCYDLIVSRATLEHLYDPLGAIKSMATCLKPGGRMLHKVDFRDHGMFTPAQPELTYLRYRRWIYRQMTQRSGRSNRILLHSYRQLAEELSRAGELQTQILITTLVGEQEIVPHVPYARLSGPALQRAVARVEAQRARMSSEFSGISSQDLAVTGIFWVALRPHCASASPIR